LKDCAIECKSISDALAAAAAAAAAVVVVDVYV
jgi:hypothetical protein